MEMTIKRYSSFWYWIFIILVLLLVISGFYIFDNEMLKQKAKYLQQGAEIGYKQALTDVSSRALRCEPYYISIDNKTIAISEVRC